MGTGKGERQNEKGKATGEGNLESQVIMEGQVQREKKCTWQMQDTYGGRLISAMLNLCH